MQERGGRNAAGAQSTSSTAVTLPRRISQATPRMSAMPTSARPRSLYFDTPSARWRWLTGPLTVFQPPRGLRAGRYRCIWSKYVQIGTTARGDSAGQEGRVTVEGVTRRKKHRIIQIN